MDNPGGGGGGIGGGTTCPITPRGNTIKSPKKNIALLSIMLTTSTIKTHNLSRGHK